MNVKGSAVRYTGKKSLSIWAIRVTLTLKIANQYFCMAFQIWFGYKKIWSGQNHRYRQVFLILLIPHSITLDNKKIFYNPTSTTTAIKAILNNNLKYVLHNKKHCRKQLPVIILQTPVPQPVILLVPCDQWNWCEVTHCFPGCMHPYTVTQTLCPVRP